MKDRAMQYRSWCERARQALQSAADLSPAEKLVALVMAEHINFKIFADTGKLECRPGEARLRAWLGSSSRRTVARTRARLRAIGAATGGGTGGRGHDEPVYIFSRDWIDRTLAGLESRLGELQKKRGMKRRNCATSGTVSSPAPAPTPAERVPTEHANCAKSGAERVPGEHPDSVRKTPQKDSPCGATTESVAARASQAEPPSRPQFDMLLPLRGGRQTSEGRPAARATPIAQAGARVVADLGAPAAELLAKAGLRRLGDWTRRLAAEIDLDAAGARLEKIAATVAAKPGAGIATLEAAVEAELAGAGSRELPASPVRAVATAPSPSRRDPCRYQRWAGCTVDSYKPDADAMGAWAAAAAPLVENPVAPETVEAIKDGWRKRGFSPKDFDAAFRDDLRWRQDRAAQSGARGAAAGGRRRGSGLVAAAMAAVAEMAEAAHG